MNDYIALMIIFSLFVCVAVEIHIWLKLRMVWLKDRTQFRFCQIRRDLMKLVHEAKLPVESFVFSTFYGSSSDIIHYIDDYKFDSAKFIKAISNRPSTSDLQQIEKLIKEIKTYDVEVQDVAASFFLSIDASLKENCNILKVMTANEYIANLFRQSILWLKNIVEIEKLEKFALQTNIGLLAALGSKALIK